MRHKAAITILVLLISLISFVAAGYGIFSSGGSGPYEFTSIHGQTVTIYGRGLYQHMSADVAVQGIAQDYVTLLLGIPLLLISLFFARRGSVRGSIVLSGTSLYFLLTYLFYTAMAAYNMLFLAYVILLCTSLFTFTLTLMSYTPDRISTLFPDSAITKISGIFIAGNSLLIASLWLGILIPPLLDGTIYPKELEHYTTFIVQGFDLGIFLPAAFVSGVLAIKKHPYGRLFTAIQLVFLSVLMTALNSKLLFMSKAGANVIPAIFLIPAIWIVCIGLAILMVNHAKTGRLT